MQLADELKYFTGVLTSFQSKAKDEEVYNVFVIKHECEGEVQTFLDLFSEKTGTEIAKHFKTPVYFKSIQFEIPCQVALTFDELECSATLLSIKATRTYKAGVEKFVYSLAFSSDDFANLQVLSTFLNQKETDENGKKKTILYDVQVKIESKLAVVD